MIGKNPRRILELLFQVTFCLIISLLTPDLLEHKFVDWKFRIWRHQPMLDEIFILKVDQKEFLQRKKSLKEQSAENEYNVSEVFERPQDVFLWDSNLYKNILTKLNGMKPKALVWTFYFPESLFTQIEDPALKDLARQKNTIWSSRFDGEGNFLRPPLVLSPTGNFGFNNLDIQSDGVVRSFTLITDNEISLPAKTHYVVNSSFDGLPNPLVQQWINWRGEGGSFPSCKLSEFLDYEKEGGEGSPCHGMENKIILVGRYGPEAQKFQTPLGSLNRVEVISNILETILSGNIVTSISYWFKPIIALILVILTGIASFALPPLGAFISIIGMSAVYLSINFLVFHIFAINIPFVFVVPAMLLAGFTLTLYRANMEAQLRWKVEQENQLMKEVDRLKANFVSLVSHDLKTPISKIQALSERMLRGGELSEEGTGSINSILKSNEELKRYITGMINLSRVEASKVLVNRKSGDINEVIEEVAERHQFSAHEKNVQIRLELEPIFAFEFDEELIRQVISNLVDNAIKFSPVGGEILVEVRELSGKVQVSVSDHGPGIPARELSRIFEKFARVEAPPQNNVGGSGLGLYLSKYFIELHGGRIFAQSEPQKGSQFTFTLPLEPQKIVIE